MLACGCVGSKMALQIATGTKSKCTLGTTIWRIETEKQSNSVAGWVSDLFFTCSLSGQRESGGMKEENEEKRGY